MRGREMSRRSCSKKREENQEGVRAVGWVAGFAGPQALTLTRLGVHPAASGTW